MTRRTPARVQRKRLLAGVFLVAYLLTLAAIMSPLARAHHLNPDRHPWSIRLVHKTDHAVRSARYCQSYLDRDRSPMRSSRSYARETVAYRQWAHRLWRGREWRCGVKVRKLNATPGLAVAYVFGRVGQAVKALSVVRCESNFWPYARNGQYLGLWQMGDFARGRYGHSWEPLAQSWSAFAYWREAGWGPWACA